MRTSTVTTDEFEWTFDVRGENEVFHLAPSTEPSRPDIGAFAWVARAWPKEAHRAITRKFLKFAAETLGWDIWILLSRSRPRLKPSLDKDGPPPVVAVTKPPKVGRWAMRKRPSSWANVRWRTVGARSCFSQ